MKKVAIILILTLGFVTFTKAQSPLNEYKYVIVPNSFNFLKSNNQYELNSLTKFLFNKYGFTALMEGENYPEDLANNGCLALHSDVEKIKGFFITKLKVVLKNCKNEIIFTSKVGETKEKDFKKAYYSALRSAFTSFESVNYNYKLSKNSVASTSKLNTGTDKEIKKSASTTIVVTAKKEKNDKEKLPILRKEEMQIPIIDLEHYTDNGLKTLYTQEIKSDTQLIIGYQLVDTEPKKVMEIYFSGVPDLFIVKGEDAILFKKEGMWVYIKNNDKENASLGYIIKF